MGPWCTGGGYKTMRLAHKTAMQTHVQEQSDLTSLLNYKVISNVTIKKIIK